MSSEDYARLHRLLRAASILWRLASTDPRCSWTIPLEGFGLSAEDSAALHALMAVETVDVNQERLEFLG